MLDRAATALIKPLVDRAARLLVGWKISANQLSVSGFALGLVAAALIISGHFLAAAATIVLPVIARAAAGRMAKAPVQSAHADAVTLGQRGNTELNRDIGVDPQLGLNHDLVGEQRG